LNERSRLKEKRKGRGVGNCGKAAYQSGADSRVRISPQKFKAEGEVMRTRTDSGNAGDWGGERGGRELAKISNGLLRKNAWKLIAVG